MGGRSGRATHATALFNVHLLLKRAPQPELLPVSRSLHVTAAEERLGLPAPYGKGPQACCPQKGIRELNEGQ
jgi:hypothetical protein